MISLSLSGRSVASRARAIRKEIRVARSMGSAVARPGVRRQRPVRRLRPGIEPVRCGTSRRPASSPSGPARRSPASAAGRGTSRRRSTRTIGMIAAPAALPLPAPRAREPGAEDRQAGSPRQRCGRSRSRASPQRSQNASQVARGVPVHSSSAAVRWGRGASSRSRASVRYRIASSCCSARTAARRTAPLTPGASHSLAFAGIASIEP